MTWTKTFPTEPGRYWWRAPSRHPKVPPSYGLLLVAWTEPSLVRSGFEPDLRIRTMVTFDGGAMDGESAGGGWSTGGGYSNVDFVRHHPGVEFWSQSELGPNGYMPALPGKPDWTPPDPVAEAAERAASTRQRAKEKAAEDKAFADRVADAVKRGAVLYRCDECQAIYDHDALVQVRECPHCGGEKFNGTENGQACPSCNRRFTRNLTELGCPDCLGEEDCEPLPETPEPVKVQSKKTPPTPAPPGGFAVLTDHLLKPTKKSKR